MPRRLKSSKRAQPHIFLPKVVSILKTNTAHNQQKHAANGQNHKQQTNIYKKIIIKSELPSKRLASSQQQKYRSIHYKIFVFFLPHNSGLKMEKINKQPSNNTASSHSTPNFPREKMPELTPAKLSGKVQQPTTQQNQVS